MTGTFFDVLGDVQKQKRALRRQRFYFLFLALLGWALALVLFAARLATL